MYPEKDLVLNAIETLDESDTRAVRDAIYLSVLWGISDPEVGKLADAHREDALRALHDAADAIDRGWWWHAQYLLTRFSSDELAAAGFDEMAVERRRAEEESEKRIESGEQAEPPPGFPEVEPPEKPPNLSTLLSYPRENGDQVIQYAASELSEKVHELTEEEREDLPDASPGLVG